MEFLISIVKVVHLLVSMFLILVVLLQPGKSGDLGAVFGGGTSESVFGASGAVPFLVKLTRILAVLFVITSLSLGYYSVKSIGTSVIKDVDTTEQVIEEVQEEEVVDESGVFLNQEDLESLDNLGTTDPVENDQPADNSKKEPDK